jgi:hypothetical protein
LWQKNVRYALEPLAKVNTTAEIRIAVPRAKRPDAGDNLIYPGFLLHPVASLSVL